MHRAIILTSIKGDIPFTLTSQIRLFHLFYFVYTAQQNLLTADKFIESSGTVAYRAKDPHLLK